MKKIVKVLILTLLIFNMSSSVYAQNTIVDVNVKGEIEKNNNIEIKVNLNQVSRLYAASVDFEYDKSLLKVQSIEPSSFIKNDKLNIMEFGKEIDKNGNIANYYFTCIGDEDGVSGSGNFVTIKAKVLKDGKLAINSENMKIKLVQKTTKNEIVNLDFKYSGYNSSSSDNTNNDNNSNIGDSNTGSNGLNDNNETDDNDSDSVNNGSSESNTNNEIDDNVSHSVNDESNESNTNNDISSNSSDSINNDSNDSDKIASNNSENGNNVINNDNKETIGKNNSSESNKNNPIDKDVTLGQDTVVKSYKTSSTYIFILIMVVSIIFSIGYVVYKKHK